MFNDYKLKIKGEKIILEEIKINPLCGSVIEHFDKKGKEGKKQNGKKQ